MLIRGQSSESNNNIPCSYSFILEPHRGVRTSRFQILSTGTLFNRYVQMSANMLAQADWWMQLPQTEANATEVWRLSCRAQAIIALTRVQFSQWAYRLSTLLGDTAAVEEEMLCFVSAPACGLDPFSVRLREQFGTVEALKSAKFQAMLAAYVHMQEGTTFSTERLHSRNARRTHARRMTHQQDLAGLAVFHQGVAAPRWAVDFMTPPSDRPVKRRHAKGKTRAAHSRGGGGAWRALVHSKRSEPDERGRLPTFAELGVMYRSLSVEEKAHYQDLGARATKLQKVVEGPCFPRTAAAASTANKVAAARQIAKAERELDLKYIMKQDSGKIAFPKKPCRLHHLALSSCNP